MNLIEQATRPQQDNTRRIPLTQGQFAIVDAADYEWLSQWKWCARPSKRNFYAARAGLKQSATRCPNILMHRQILGLEYGDTRQGDHIDGQTLNNRRSNLRVASSAGNAKNRRINLRGSSGYKGVCWSKESKCWQAQIQNNRKHIHLGRFKTKEAAYEAYCVAAKALHGEFANLG